jgi:hypothetical protein
LTERSLAHLRDKHPEELARLHQARAAIERPDLATRPADYPQRVCYYRAIPGSRLRTKVVVHYRPVAPQGTWIGEVITAYRTDHVGRQEMHLWP